jgi:hypothetical protein
MPKRILREGILTSEPINALSAHAELFYRRLMSIVDDFGRYEANPKLLRIYCYPLKIDVTSTDNISSWLSECEERGLIETYEADGKRYLEITKWRQELRNVRSKFPGRDGQFTLTGISRTKAAPAHNGPHVGPTLDTRGVRVATESESESESLGKSVSSAKPTQPASVSDPEWINGLKSDPAYEGIDIERAIARCRRWCSENKKHLTRRRITNWLNKEDKPIAIRNESQRQPKKWGGMYGQDDIPTLAELKRRQAS